MRRPSLEEARVWFIERQRRNRALREVSSVNLPEPVNIDVDARLERKYLDGVTADEIGDLARKLEDMMGVGRRR